MWLKQGFCCRSFLARTSLNTGLSTTLARLRPPVMTGIARHCTAKLIINPSNPILKTLFQGKGILALLVFFVVLFCPLSITCSLHDKDFRVVNESVSNRCGHSGTVKYLSPFRKGQVCRYNTRLPFMPCTDNLEE